MSSLHPLRRPLVLLGLLLVLAGAGGLGYMALSGGSEAPAPVAVAPATPAVTPTLEPAGPTPTPVSTSPVTRLTIPAIAVDARVVTLGVDPDGTMQSPDNPKDVAWYTFAAHPGYSGNVVLAGHVDWAGYGPAVFWRLRDLKPGDDVYVDLEDGTRFAYRVATVTAYNDATAPVAQIVGPTPDEVVTLITCTGVFDTAAHNYNQRLVVVAGRVPDQAAAPRS